MDCSNSVLLNINWISWHKLEKADRPWFFQVVFIQTKVGLKIMQKVLISLLYLTRFLMVLSSLRENKTFTAKLASPNNCEVLW